MKEGGPVLRLRAAAELAAGGEEGALASAVLRTQKTRMLLDQLAAFGPFTGMDIRVLNSLHGMKPECLENVIPRLLERGLRAGVPAFDTMVKTLVSYVDNPVVRAGLSRPGCATVEQGRAVFFAVVASANLLRAGWRCDEAVAFVLARLDAISRLADEGSYDIHLRGAGLSGVPSKWEGKPILRPEVVPTSGTKPLPLIHDIFAFAFLPRSALSPSRRRRLGSRIRYIIDDRYRALPDGYGYIWNKSNPGVCYGCGWSVDLPDPAAGPQAQAVLVQRLELMSLFPEARVTRWFTRGLAHLEGFRTARGTWHFPAAYLPEKPAGYYVGGAYMGLEDGRRSPMALELESTFRMLLVRARARGRPPSPGR